jgi:hypothetical protein
MQIQEVFLELHGFIGLVAGTCCASAEQKAELSSGLGKLDTAHSIHAYARLVSQISICSIFKVFAILQVAHFH